MKDIDDLFKGSAGASPNRPLRTDFTNKVINNIVANPRKSWFAHFTENFMEKVLTKPAMAVAAIVFTVLAAGSAYAAISWPPISAFFNSETPTSDGRIVEVKTDNCVFENAFVMTKTDKTNDTYFYKVKSDSKLTNEEVVQIVKGNCQSEAQIEFDSKVMMEALEKNPLNKDTIVGGTFSTVVAASENSITLKTEMPTDVDGKEQIKIYEQTFNRIDPEVFVFDSPNRISMTDLKIGDQISFKYRASGKALTHSETTPVWEVNPDEQVIVAIVKTPAALADALKYQKYNGREFEQVVPCEHTANGFCTVSEYYQHKQ
jgi:hypothetical protein